MKKIYLLLLVLSSCFTTINAQQNWDLFPLNQRTFFNNNDTLVTYWNDSTLVNGEHRTHFFGAKYYYEKFDNCTDIFTEQIWADADIAATFAVDTMYSTTEFYYQLFGQDTVKFFHKAAVNTTWEVPTIAGNAFQITCEGDIEVDNWGIGVTENNRSFSLQYLENGQVTAHPLNDFIFTLGEFFGFVDFVSLKDLYLESADYQVFSCIGFDSETQAAGYTGNIEDYIHFEVGEVLKWHKEQISEPDDNLEVTEEYFIDTVQAITENDLFIFLEVHRTRFLREYSQQTGWTENFFPMETASFAYSKPFLQSTLDTPSDFPILNNNPIRYYHTPPTITNGIVFEKGIGLPNNYSWVFPDCMLNLEPIGPAEFRYSTELGLIEVYQEDTDGGSYLLELLGYQNADFTWGDVGEVTNAQNVENQTIVITVAPNPTKDFIQVTLPKNINNNDLNIRLFDAFGRLILTTNNTTISLANLPNGYYFLTIENDVFRASKKVLKF